MEKRVLSNGVEIPAIGLGVYLSPEGQATADSVRWAVEAGYRHIDTAAVYGNECSVGEGIKTCGIPRDQLFLTSKLWNDDIRKGRALDAFKESLERLGTDYLDLYLIHWPADGHVKAWHAAPGHFVRREGCTIHIPSHIVCTIQSTVSEINTGGIQTG